MRVFLKNMLFCALLAGLLFLYVFVQKDQVWKITNSISIDAKLAYGRIMDAEDLDIIALGSSMTLNNLNSEKVIESLAYDLKFFNYGAFGLQIQDMKIMLENLLQTSDPQCIIIVSNIPEFVDDQESRYSGKDLRNYMDGHLWNDVLLAVRYGFPNNLDSIKDYEYYRNQIYDYGSLNYDAYGGVALQVYGENINDVRWNVVLEEDAKEMNYVALEKLCKLASDNDIRLYFAQSPSRAHYTSGEGSKEIMQAHMERCREIVEGSGQYYYSIIDPEKYEDIYFADYTHLNREGSQLFTEEFMEFYQQCEMAVEQNTK